MSLTTRWAVDRLRGEGIDDEEIAYGLGLYMKPETETPSSIPTPRELTHPLRDLAFLFLHNPQLTGVEDIAKGRTDKELIVFLDWAEETLKRFSTEELVPFDAYPWETVKDVSGDQERAEELGVPVAEFRKNWNKVYRALRSNLRDAILDEALSRRIAETAPA